MLAYTAREDQGVETTERSGEGADALLCMIAKHRHGILRTDIGRGPIEQILHPEVVSDTPSNPDSWLIICSKRLGVICSMRAK